MKFKLDENLSRQDKRHVLGALARLISQFASEPLKGRLWIVEEQRLRIRSE